MRRTGRSIPGLGRKARTMVALDPVSHPGLIGLIITSRRSVHGTCGAPATVTPTGSRRITGLDRRLRIRATTPDGHEHGHLNAPTDASQTESGQRRQRGERGAEQGRKHDGRHLLLCGVADLDPLVVRPHSHHAPFADDQRCSRCDQTAAIARSSFDQSPNTIRRIPGGLPNLALSDQARLCRVGFQGRSSSTRALAPRPRSRIATPGPGVRRRSATPFVTHRYRVPQGTGPRGG